MARTRKALEVEEWRDGMWRAQVTVGAKANGQRDRRRFTHTAANNAAGKAEANRALRAWLVAAEAEAPSVREAGTVADALAQWQRDKAHGWAEATRNTHATLGARIADHLGTVKVSALTPAMVLRFYTELREGIRPGHPEYTHKMANGAVKGHYQTLHACMSYAVRTLGWATSNPADSAAAPWGTVTTTEVVRNVPTEDLAEVFRYVPEADPFYTYLRVVWDTGARRGELGALRWSGVDLEGASVVLYGKTRKARRVALAPVTVDALKAHRARVVARAMAAGLAADLEDAYVWAGGRDGLNFTTPMRPDSLTQRAGRLSAAMGVKFSIQDFRRHAATSLLGANLSVADTAARLGHSPAVLLSRYASAIPANDARAAEVMARLANGQAAN